MNTELREQPQLAHQNTGERQIILIIDDDEAMTDVLSRRLRHQGFDTLTADTGADGFSIAQARAPALIVLDVRLPDADGFTLCQRLVDSPDTCDIPVIVLSGMERPDVVRRSRAAGCSFFVRKPYDPNVLLVLIRQAILERTLWAEP